MRLMLTEKPAIYRGAELEGHMYEPLRTRELQCGFKLQGTCWDTYYTDDKLARAL